MMMIMVQPGLEVNDKCSAVNEMVEPVTQLLWVPVKLRKLFSSKDDRKAELTKRKAGFNNIYSAWLTSLV